MIQQFDMIRSDCDSLLEQLRCSAVELELNWSCDALFFVLILCKRHMEMACASRLYGVCIGRLILELVCTVLLTVGLIAATFSFYF